MRPTTGLQVWKKCSVSLVFKKCKLKNLNLGYLFYCMSNPDKKKNTTYITTKQKMLVASADKGVVNSTFLINCWWECKFE